MLDFSHKFMTDLHLNKAREYIQLAKRSSRMPCYIRESRFECEKRWKTFYIRKAEKEIIMAEFYIKLGLRLQRKGSLCRTP